MNHTPGPWKVDAREHGAKHVITGKGSAVAWIQGYGSADTLAAAPLKDDREANARLIAAAPALLEALRDLADRLQGGDKFETLPPWCQEMIAQARAAIALAEKG